MADAVHVCQVSDTQQDIAQKEEKQAVGSPGDEPEGIYVKRDKYEVA